MILNLKRVKPDGCCPIPKCVRCNFPPRRLRFCVQRPHKASGEEMTKYHSDDYIKFLRSIRPDNMSEYSKQMQRCERFYLFLPWTPEYPHSSRVLSFSFFLQSTLERTVRCLTVCLSFASSQQVDLLVSYPNGTSRNSPCEQLARKWDIYDTSSE